MPALKEIDELFVHLDSKNDKERYEAFKTLLDITEKKVKWIYDKWYLLIEKLSSDNSFQRSIGLLLIANLVKSDENNRIIEILDEYLNHLDDEKFITSRQTIQNVWKIALKNNTVKVKVIKALEDTYYNNKHLATHGNLIKQDVISSLAQIYNHTKDETLLNRINSFIDEENDVKIKKVLKKSAAIV